MTATFYSIIPPIVMIILVLITRRVLLSLSVGIITSVLIISQYDFLHSVQLIWESFYQLFYFDGTVNAGNIYLLLFLLFLGILTAYMTASGGTKAFGTWAIKKVETRRGAQLFPFFFGILIFIDDYFNSLAVGQVARPLTDPHRLSRAKLAYIIDSTSAPIAVLAPISSWGAFIIGTLSEIFEKHHIEEYTPLEAFVKMVPLNLYAISTIILVFIVVVFNINIGPMKKHEDRAMKTGKLVNPERESKVISSELKEWNEGKIVYLLVPIVTLIFVTIAAMVITGLINGGEGVSLLSLFNYTDVNLSLFSGGMCSLIVMFIYYARISSSKPSHGEVIREGAKSMLTAIYILVLAWMLGDVIEQLGTGAYLTTLIQDIHFSVQYLPLLIFALCGIMAFSTGTSWGTFGIMLPIAASIVMEWNSEFLLPALAAVLAGSVFGDHCSPISDTTILSSTGAGSNHIDHVITQLPYAFIGAIATLAGYIVLGITGVISISIITALLLLILTVIALNRI